ncbi:MAG: site-2 protease family protein [Veillonellaceae bacterium]|nr:site-2 protease family protein [Veillonellaceae bacterium]MDD6922821.1 site-2 protease family protein [Veillonellaceae bacterium]
MFGMSLLSIVAGIPGLLIAMVLHEYAHAWMAVKMGDFTPRMMGRLTLNPVAHIDLIGLIMLLLVRFGWAKPVIINPNNFKNIRKGEILTAFAGPLMNLIVAFVFLVLYAFMVKYGVNLTQGVNLVFTLIIIYNINFAIFNLLPLPPLDGGRILMMLLPSRWAYKMMQLERYSFLILIVLMMTPFLGTILVPLQKLVWFVFSAVIGLIV